MFTYQDFLAAGDKTAFCSDLVSEHMFSGVYRVAVDADEYDHQRNTTISNFVQKLFSSNGREAVNFVAANNRITSNLFRRLNVQRNVYSLGNGVTFPDSAVKDRLGKNFDNVLQKAGYAALIHGVSFVFWNFNRAYCFRLTEFAPLYDENTGALMAGVRFWRVDVDKPLNAVLYELDGYTVMRSPSGSGQLSVIDEKKPYKQRVLYSAADGAEFIGGDNYSALPIVPLWGSSLRQSTLVGMKQSIDAYDIINSGFANDLSDCAQIYWIIKNAGGMSDDDLDRLRTRMLMTHMITVDADSGADVVPHQVDIPFTARESCLERLKAGIYEDFGGLDVHTIAAGSTNDHIDAAYQPLDENADDFEYNVIDCVSQLLALQGIVDNNDAVPQFKRNRICNVKEQAEIVALEAPYLDDETILSKLPNITVDEVEGILSRRAADELNRFNGGTTA